MRPIVTKGALVLFAITAALLPCRLMAQVSTATVSGIVADSTGAIIPHLKIVAKDQATGIQVQAVSDEAGQLSQAPANRMATEGGSTLTSSTSPP